MRSSENWQLASRTFESPFRRHDERFYVLIEQHARELCILMPRHLNTMIFILHLLLDPLLGRHDIEPFGQIRIALP